MALLSAAAIPSRGYQYEYVRKSQTLFEALDSAKIAVLALAGHACFRGWGTLLADKNEPRRVNATGVPGRLQALKLYSWRLQMSSLLRQMRGAN